MIVNCKTCQKEFKTKPCLVKIGKGKYCKKECYDKSLIGKPNKSSTKFKKGQKPSKKWYELLAQGKVGFSKGYTPHNKGVKGYANNGTFKKGELVGRLHPMWREDDYGYSAIHMWVKSKLGKAVDCVDCGSKNDKATQYGWANISRLYLRDLNDWKSLCAKCHSQFDRNNKQEVYNHQTGRRVTV